MMIKIYFSFLLFILLNLTLLGQYNLDSFDKTSTGIEKTKTIHQRYKNSYIYVQTATIKERVNSQSFIEQNNALYYYKDNEYFELEKLKNSNNGHYPILYDNQKKRKRDTIYPLLKKCNLPIKVKRSKYLFDNDNNLWITSIKTGVCYIEKKDTIHYTTLNGLPSNRVNDLIMDEDGIIWIATKKGLCKIENGKWSIFTETKSNKKIKNVKRLEELQNGGVFFKTSNSELGIYNGEEFRYLDVSSRSINGLLKDEYNHIWVTLGNFGLLLILNKEEFYAYDSSNGYNNESILKTFKDFQENIWIVTPSAIGKLSKDKKQIIFFPTEVTKIQAISQENKRRLWFLGLGGSAYFDYESNKLINLNQIYNIKTNKSSFNKQIAPELLGIGKTYKTRYKNSDLIFDNKSNYLYTQYNIIEDIQAAVVVDVIKVKEYPLILLINSDGIINISEQMTNFDNRPLNTYLDSDGNFWIDTPTQIHKITIH